MSKEDIDRRRVRILKNITKAANDLREKSPGRYVPWTHVAKLLNDRGVMTIYGKTWTGETLSRYCSEHLPNLNLDQADNQVCASQSQGSESFESKGTVGALNDEEVQQVRQMLKDYRKGKLVVGDLTRRPKFKNPRPNSGIRCNEEIRKRASAKAKEMKKETGGNLNSLIELLLWQFIGCPDDVVQGYEIDS